METKRFENRPGRFSYLLKGGAKPRRNHVLMVALALMVLLSFAGMASADDYYKGAAPELVLHGCVNGSVDVQFADAWNTTPVEDWSKQETWANFTLNHPPGATPKFAELVVVDYLGSMSADYFGTMTVKLYNGDTYETTLVDNQSLSLSYDNASGASYAVVSPPLVNLSRVTSDYVADFDVTNALTGWGGSTVNVSLTSFNLTGVGRFDGRFKEAKLAYGWDVPPESSDGYTCYFKYLGHDPITKRIGTYTANQTVFNIDDCLPFTYTANLWVDFVAGNSTSGPGYGKYWWNGGNFTAESEWDGGYPPADWIGSKYAGINHWTWNQDSTNVTMSDDGNNVLEYSRTNDYYKIVFALLTIHPCPCCLDPHGFGCSG
jgi:hypothetical protein